MKKKKKRRKPPSTRHKIRKRTNLLLTAGAIRQWQGQVEGCLKFLYTSERLEIKHGKAWVAKMRTHYRTKLTKLLQKNPPGTESLKRFYKKSLTSA